MKTIFITLCVSLSALGNQQILSAKLDGDLVHFVEAVNTPSSVVDQLTHFRTNRSRNDERVDVILDRIINMGKKIWAIIEKGRPVVDIRYDYANALPHGVASVLDLETFSDIQMASSYRFYGKNLFGMTVYDMTITPLHRFSGTYKGNGKYLTDVTGLPSQTECLWGYTCNLSVTKISTVNVGTSEQPVAGITMETTVSISTVVKSYQARTLFDFRADSATVKVL